MAWVRGQTEQEAEVADAMLLTQSDCIYSESTTQVASRLPQLDSSRVGPSTRLCTTLMVHCRRPLPPVQGGSADHTVHQQLPRATQIPRQDTHSGGAAAYERPQVAITDGRDGQEVQDSHNREGLGGTSSEVCTAHCRPKPSTQYRNTEGSQCCRHSHRSDAGGQAIRSLTRHRHQPARLTAYSQRLSTAHC